MEVPGIYESLITRLLEKRLNQLEGTYYIQKQRLDTAEAADYLARFLVRVLTIALNSFPNKQDSITKQIDLSNALVKWLADYLNDVDLADNLLDTQGQILSALFTTQNPVAADLKAHVAKITPLTGLVQSELFTGSNEHHLATKAPHSSVSMDRSGKVGCWLTAQMEFI